MMSTPEAQATNQAANQAANQARTEQLALALPLRPPRAQADPAAPVRDDEGRMSSARRSRPPGAAPRRGASSGRRRADGPAAPARRARADEPGSWRLDARTRQIGLRGVAAARRALERAAGPDQAA
ncbi:MAG: hypothetical protein M0029_12345 [Actinomycetota bacterium]|nr:hypothetical protein [Actinomycetota bacterium]